MYPPEAEHRSNRGPGDVPLQDHPYKGAVADLRPKVVWEITGIEDLVDQF